MEAGVGQGIAEGLKENGVDRKDLFVTSKVWNDDLGYDETIAAFETSLSKLGLDYLDLYLIHWPVEGKYKEAWRALETLYKQGRVKAIGVSNFHIHHLEEVMKDAEISPMVNQVELHPRLTQKELHDFCQKHAIQLEAWSPLMQGQILENEVLQDLAARYGKTTAQIIVRWNLENEIVVIPKSTKEHRILSNADVYDFELSDEDRNPDNFDF